MKTRTLATITGAGRGIYGGEYRVIWEEKGTETDGYAYRLKHLWRDDNGSSHQQTIMRFERYYEAIEYVSLIITRVSKAI